MRSRFPAMFTFFVLCGSPMLAQADKQTAPPPTAEAITSVYKLSFTIRELVAGKVVSSRSYTSPSAVVNGMFQSGSIRAGDKIPEITAGTQYDYEDRGKNRFQEFRASAGFYAAPAWNTCFGRMFRGSKRCQHNWP